MNNSNETLVQKILTENGLDFTIHKIPMFGSLTQNIGGMPLTTQVPSDYFALYNDKADKIINTVKKGYEVSQTDEVVRLVVEAANKFGELTVKRGASLNDGRKVVLQLELDGYASVGKDKIKRYITVLDSNDGSSGLSVGIGDLTMSCSNQFFKFYKESDLKMRHTASLKAKLANLVSTIEIMLSESMKMIELYNDFVSTPITRSLANQLVNELVGLDRTASIKEIEEASAKKRKAMETLYAHIDKEINCKGLNLWGLHSGVTSWTTHEKSAPRRENGRLDGILTGTNYKVNQKSLDFAIAQMG